MTIKTQADMRAQLIHTLDEGTPEGHKHYNLVNILDELYEAAGRSWDLDHVPNGAFWMIVSENEIQPLSGEELLTVLVKHYASARLSSRDVLASELLTVAAQHTLSMNEDAATERVGELIEEFYASRG